MTLNIDHDDTVMPHIDRDGRGVVAHDGETVEGFVIGLDHLYLHFEDERDAVRIAELILRRMGKDQ